MPQLQQVLSLTMGGIPHHRVAVRRFHSIGNLEEVASWTQQKVILLWRPKVLDLNIFESVVDSGQAVTIDFGIG